VARDAAANTAPAAAVSVTVNNADTTPPTVTGSSPAAGATGVSTSATIRATFSEAMSASTVTTATFVLRNAAGTAVAATVVYDAPTRTATLTPSQLLATSTTYTATITGGASGAKDVAGNGLTNNFVWSFTTAPPRDTVSIQLAAYTVSTAQLRLDARSSATNATLTAFVTSTGVRIGTLRNAGGGRYRATFSWPSNPNNVTIRSSLGGQAAAAVVTN
jgi:hypothetical protein